MKTFIYILCGVLFFFVVIAYCVADSHEDINNGMEPCLMNPLIECGSNTTNIKETHK
jgi:hypothetical protein